MKKKFFITLAFIGLFSLIACNNNDDDDYYSENRYDDEYYYTDNDDDDDYYYTDNGYDEYDYDYYYDENNEYDYEYDYDDETGYNGVDRHYDFVTGLGFDNVVNPNGYTFHERYRLDKTNAANHDIFHGWRHTWVEPNNYINKDIDVYRYTADYNGEPRTVHIKSYNGKVLGGYHFGEGETAEHARIINHNGYTSRLHNDFRGTWDNLFDI